MQMTIDVGYDQVLQLFQQLPPRDRARFVREVAPAEQEPALSETEPHQDLIVLERRNGLVVYQVPFPDTEEGRIRQKEQEQLQEKFRENYPEFFVLPSQEEIAKKRQEALRLIAECPVATQEDIDDLIAGQKEFRRLFRCRPM